MKNYELYKRTCDILYDAYFNDTLEHGNCAACAVANIILSRNGISHIRDENGKPGWPHDKISYSGANLHSWYGVVVWRESGDEYITNMLSKTDYSIDDLTKIETAFEMVKYGGSEEDHMYNGLVSVLECLKEIHEIADEDSGQLERFTEHRKTKSLCNT